MCFLCFSCCKSCQVICIISPSFCFHRHAHWAPTTRVVPTYTIPCTSCTVLIEQYRRYVHLVYSNGDQYCKALAREKKKLMTKNVVGTVSDASAEILSAEFFREWHFVIAKIQFRSFYLAFSTHKHCSIFLHPFSLLLSLSLLLSSQHSNEPIVLDDSRAYSRAQTGGMHSINMTYGIII